MSDVGDALSTLCGLVNSLTNVDITSEHLRLAKCNAADESVAETLWSTLRVLSCHATRETRGDVHFRDYDAPSAVKLHLAFLQYPVIEFYSLPQSGQYNRDALIALGWLLGTQNGLTAILRAKLADSILGAECSRVDPPESPSSAAVPNDRPLSTSAKFSSILHLNATVNLNLREINELARERVKLISKVHAASLDVSGLPHLSVSELALTKRLARARVLGSGEGGSSEKDRQQLRQFREIGTLLEANAKWLRKRHIFFNWMATVIQEHRRSLESNPRVIRTRDLAAFNSLLRHAIRDKLGIVTFEESMDSSGSRNSVLNCPSRAQRSQCNNAEAQSWLNDLSERQDHEEENFQRNKKRLADELKEMLELIPSVVRV
ncbi:PREDICTED: uncharacterized protein LOC105565661 [Vollenhovia emeryi]|uniref:uncharacterized protein LOC105565661 n=1 Tax=Vollenhovia emeryi TaxID=411798 RepID=UPI0005F3BDA9|nr:PREDICTED: uncharacterized protein LOC105565661 [Vollenhovia emeryi]XP_011874425.1 PREDICTED: uncharacterized protein LOC105565661 [Vollenhovia emeryi]